MIPLCYVSLEKNTQMKSYRLLKSTLVALFCVLCGRLFPQIQHLEWQGTQREYILRLPMQHDGDMPIVYFLHGLGDNITRVDNQYNFTQVANNYGWAVVVPQALPQQNLGTMWNAGLMQSTIDDSGFLMALLDSLSVQYPIDLDSVFFTGFSMGGFMSHRMAIEHGDRITACAPVSGLITHSMSALTPPCPVRMLHIHGTSDPVVGYDGNSQYFGGNLGLSVEAILNYWKSANGCVEEPVIDTFPNLKNDNLLFVRYNYEGDATLQHIKVIGGSHNWYNNSNQYDISYMEVIHDFFTYDDFDPTSIGNDVQTRPFLVRPNPCAGLCIIETEEVTQIEVVDMTGRIVCRQRLEPGENQLNLVGLPNGIYLIRDGKGRTTKVVLEAR